MLLRIWTERETESAGCTVELYNKHVYTCQLFECYDFGDMEENAN